MILVLAGCIGHVYSQGSGNVYCSFDIGPGSALSGSYEFRIVEDQSFAYHDFENEQFVIEIHGDNYMDAMLIIERPDTGKHVFSMEMQVAIEMSTNDGEDYFVFDNYRENGGGYIQIDRLDDPEGIVSGSFSGIFFDGATDEDRSVRVEGRFAVRRQ
jgi:hypothetical protein